MDWMGVAFGVVCGGYGVADEVGRGACGLKPGDGAADERGGGVCVGDCVDDGAAWGWWRRVGRGAGFGCKDSDVSNAVGVGDWIVVDLLLQSVTDGAGVAGGSARQAERAPGDGVRVAAAGGKDDAGSGRWRTADHGGGCGDGAGVAGMLGIR